MLQLNNVHTYYGDSHILQGISLQVGPGEMVSMLGRNGAGKTTTIRSIIGFNAPREGEIIFKGKKISGLPSYKIARMGLALVPQGRGIFPNLSVFENLTIGARKKNGGGWDLDKIFSYFPRLKERANNRGTQLSGGEQQMLAVARALMSNPDMILMDEPSEGLAPLIVREIGHIISQIKKEGISILLVEQNLSLALQAADRVYIVNKGRIVYESTPVELGRNDEVKKQFLGV